MARARTSRAPIWTILCGTILAFGQAVAAEDFEAKAPDPPGDVTGTAPVDNGSLVALKDGRLMMVGSGTRVSYSKDGGRTWTPAKAVAVKGKTISSAGDPTSLIRASPN